MTNETKVTELDYEKLYEELKSYKIVLSPDPSPKILLNQISIVQSQRSRVSEMYMQAILNRRKFKNHWLIIWDNALPLRNEKSAEQREAAVRNENRPYYEMFKRAEDYFEIVAQIYKDLIDTNNNLARQAHIIEYEMRLTNNRDVEKPETGPTGPTSWDNV